MGGANIYTGATNLNAGSLTFSAGSSLSGGGPVNVAAGATLNLNGSVNLGGNAVTLNGDSFSSTLAVIADVGAGGGALGAASVIVGNSGNGAFTQTGGSNALSNMLLLGMNSTSSGAYTLNYGALSAVNEYIGYNGSGSFTQTGGTNTLRSTLFFGAGSGSSGSYTLSGGALELASMVRGGGTGTFNFNGGILRLNLDNATFMGGLTAAYVQSGGAQIDSNDHSIIVVQPLLNVVSGTSGGLTKLGSGTLTLAGANTYKGTTGIGGGTLTVTGSLNGATGTDLSCYNGGIFNFAEAANRTQSMGALSFNTGDNTVRSTYPGSGNTSLSFTSLSARGTGGTGNFVLNGGVNGSTNRISLGGVTYGFINPGIFFGGSNYAWASATNGYVREIIYSNPFPDFNAFTTGATASISGVSNYLYVQTTGAISAQTTATFTTLNLSGNNAFTLANGATLTVSGILKTGNAPGGATISGGTSIQTPSGGDLVIRTDGVNDALTIDTPIALNGNNSLTKSGAGTLTLSKNNPYTGTTTVGAGTMTIAATGSLSGGGVIYINPGITLNISGAVGNGSISFSGNQLNANGTNSNPATVNLLSGGMLRLSSEYLNNGFTGSFVQSGGSHSTNYFYLGAFSSNGDGSYTLNGGNMTGNYEYVGYGSNAAYVQNGGTNTVGYTLGLGIFSSGSYTLSGGTLQTPIISGGNLGVFNFNGGILQAVGSPTTLMSGLKAANVQAGGAKIDSNNRNAAISQSLVHDPALNATVDGGLTKLGAGTIILKGANTYTGNTIINAGALAVGGSINNTGTIQVTNGAALEVSNSGKVSVGQINNAGRLRLKGSGMVAASGTIYNTGTVDLIEWNGALPSNFVNDSDSAIIDASNVRITGIVQSGPSIRIAVQVYAGHTYVLQSSPSLNPPNWTDVYPRLSITPSADGKQILGSNPPSGTTQQFYRVRIEP